MPSCSETAGKRRKKTVTSAKKKVRKKKVVKKARKPVAKKTKTVVKKRPAVKKKSVTKKAQAQPQQTRWLSIAVMEGNEIQVAKFIGRLRGVVRVLLPTYDDSALYPGYVFSECDFSDDVLMDICHLADVEGILSKNSICNYAMGGHEMPAELKPEALRSIRESEARYAKLVRKEMTIVEKGQKITITSGVFSGMSGYIVSVNRRKMSVIVKVRLSDGGMVRKVSVKHGQFDVMECDDNDDGWRL